MCFELTEGSLVPRDGMSKHNLEVLRVGEGVWPWMISAQGIHPWTTRVACPWMNSKLDKSFVERITPHRQRSRDRRADGAHCPYIRPGRGGRGA